MVYLWFGWHAISAQDQTYETIFSKRATRGTPAIRGYGGFSFIYNPVFYDNRAYHLLDSGARFGITIKKKLSLGFALQEIGAYNNDHPLFKKNNDNISISINQFALESTYRTNPEKAFHFGFNLVSGLVYVEQLTLMSNNLYDRQHHLGFVVNPNLRYEANLTPWMGVYLSAGYRFTTGGSKFGIDLNNDLHGPVFQVGVNFGKLR